MKGFFSCLFAAGFFLASVSAEGTRVGKLSNLQHGIGGEVFIVDEHTLLIKDFEYDGAGPDAFFWAGTQGKPSSVGTILPYPFNGKFYEYEDGNAPILEGRFDKKEIKLTLPEDLKTTDLKWLSVWCRAFKVNFGEIFFPEDIAAPEAEAESESEPETGAEPEDHDHHGDLPPPLLPPNNAHDPEHRDHHGDSDAEPESESEPVSEAEAESESHSGASNVVTSPRLCHIVFAGIVSCLLRA